jgi:hypothetical protein
MGIGLIRTHGLRQPRTAGGGPSAISLTLTTDDRSPTARPSKTRTASDKHTSPHRWGNRRLDGCQNPLHAVQERETGNPRIRSLVRCLRKSLNSSTRPAA